MKGGPTVLDVDLLPQNGRVVLVLLQAGRQLEGELRVVFDGWEIEELEDVT